MRITRTEIPAADSQSGTPSNARIAQIIVTPQPLRVEVPRAKLVAVDQIQTPSIASMRPLRTASQNARVVAIVLVRVPLGEVGNRLVELVLRSQVRGNRDGVARSGVRAGERVPADPRVHLERNGRHRFDNRRALHVAQLAPIEVTVGLGPLRPAQEDVAGGLHESLALHDALSRLRVSTLRQMVLEHRRGCFFDLQEQRVLVVAALQQEDERPRADTADAHDLVGHVDHLEPLEQLAAVVGQRLAVVTEPFVDELLELLDRVAVRVREVSQWG